MPNTEKLGVMDHCVHNQFLTSFASTEKKTVDLYTRENSTWKCKIGNLALSFRSMCVYLFFFFFDCSVRNVILFSILNLLAVNGNHENTVKWKSSTKQRISLHEVCVVSISFCHFLRYTKLIPLLHIKRIIYLCVVISKPTVFWTMLTTHTQSQFKRPSKFWKIVGKLDGILHFWLRGCCAK